MKYNLQIEVAEKQPLVHMNFDIPDTVAREFKFITKTLLRTPMSRVMTEMMSDFIKVHRDKKPKQTSFI